MSNEAPYLERIERWMQAVITHPEGIGKGIASDDARQHITVSTETIEDVISRSGTLTASARLAIYSRAYRARLLGCLRAVFPVLVCALGEELFNRFASDYLKHYPSTSYTLSRLGESFPRYLAETRPDRDAPHTERESWPDFIIDLATLERAFMEVYDGPGVEEESILNEEQLSALSPEHLMKARLVQVVCLKLLAFHYPVHTYFDAARKDRDAAFPSQAETFLALNRRDYVVSLHELTRPQFELLNALMAGHNVTGAISQVAEKGIIDRDTLCDCQRAWIQKWTAEGFFHKAELQAGP